MPVKFTMGLTGNIRGLKAALMGDALYRDALRELLDAVGKKGVEIAQTNAPYKTGWLHDHIKYTPMFSQSPMAVTIRTTATRKGFNYGWHLNFAPRWHHVGWFTRPLEGLAGAITPMFRATASKIERKWASFAQRPL